MAGTGASALAGDAGHGPENLGVLRRIARDLFDKAGPKMSAARKRRRFRWSDALARTNAIALTAPDGSNCAPIRFALRCRLRRPPRRRPRKPGRPHRACAVAVIGDGWRCSTRTESSLLC